MVGDTHGDLDRCKLVIDYAVSNNCKIIIILGDFGFFPNLQGYDKFIKGLSEYSLKCGVSIHWIKGNHENHEVLQSICNGSVNVQEIHPNVFFHPNGNVWEVDGVKFLSMGGAWSIDKTRRIQGVSWFPDEEISNNDVYYSYELNDVDVVCSHDSPLSSNISEYLNFYPDPNTTSNQKKLQEVVENVRPKFLFHGHYHIKYFGHSSYTDESDNVNEIKTIGLGANTGQLADMVYIFDTEEIRQAVSNVA